MTKHNNKQLKVHHLPNYLGQINDNSSPDTKIKFLCRAANCLRKTGSLQNTNKAINLYTQAYDIQSDVRGSSHTRSVNILNFIVECEKFAIMIKKNIVERKLKLKLDSEALKKKEQLEKKEKKKAQAEKEN